MNKDINNTLQALVPILQMNGEKVQRIEAVQDWYTIDGIEYMKEVAEITYTSGYRKYADIGCDSNLTAVYDVMAVIQDIKPRSECVGRIARGVYEMPSIQPETSYSEFPNNSDTISRQQAIDELHGKDPSQIWDTADIEVWLNTLPSAQPERKKGKWIHNSPVTMKCDQCGLVIKDWDWHRFKYCPNCIADMRGDKE